MSETKSPLFPHRQTSPAEQEKYLNNILGSTGYAGIFSLPCDDTENPIPKKQTMMPVSQLKDYDFYQPQECVALNSFASTRSRSTQNLLRLNALYVDVDSYNVAGQSLESMLGTLEAYEFGYSIPRPSYVIGSGKGAYLIWLIEPCDATKENTNTWLLTTGQLCLRTRQFGSDPQCKDLVRVLRVPGSVNLKPGVNAEVRIIADNSHLRYNLDDVAAFLGVVPGQVQQNEPEHTDSSAPKKKCRKSSTGKKKKTGKRKGKNAQRKFRRSVARMRAADIAKVLVSQGIHAVGHREVALFYYRHFLMQSGYTPQRALKETLRLNQRLAEPLSNSEAVNATKTREDACYWPSNETLVSELEIDPEIEKDLETILSPDGCVRRRRLRNGRTMSRAEETALKKARIAELRAAGLTVAEVCRVMDFSKTTYYNLTKGRKPAKKKSAVVSYPGLPAFPVSTGPPPKPVCVDVSKKPGQGSTGSHMVNLLSANYMHIITYRALSITKEPDTSVFKRETIPRAGEEAFEKSHARPPGYRGLSPPGGA